MNLTLIEPKLLTNYKVALKLKNLGYDVPADYYYFAPIGTIPENDNWHKLTPIEMGYTNNNQILVSVPEITDVLEWLDSEFDIFISINSYLNGNKESKIYQGIISPNGRNSMGSNARFFNDKDMYKSKSKKDVLIRTIDGALDLIIQNGWDKPS